MPTEQDMIDRINAEQGEGIRLAEHVYISWIEDLGDPRAELIRVVVELSCRGYDENNPLRRVFLLNRALEMKRDFLGIAGG